MDIVQDAEQLAAQGVGGMAQKLEQEAGIVISKIASGAVKLWSEAESLVDADAAKVKSALPSSAAPNFDAIVSDIKQGASDTLSLVATGGAAYAPELATGLEALADSALAAATGGKSLPLVPFVNTGIDQIVSLGNAALQAWALKAKASLTTVKAS